MLSNNDPVIKQGLSAAEFDALPHFLAPTLFILDYDRTLGRVDDKENGPALASAMGRLIILAGQFGINTEAIQEAQQATQAAGNSFDPLHMIEEALSLSPGAFNTFCDKFTDPLFPSILYPDAQNIVKALQKAPVTPNVVMTYGTNPEWQKIKVAAGEYPGFVKITDSPEKGPLIAQWQNPSTGCIDLVGYERYNRPVARFTVGKSVLIDDKIKSFRNLPPNCTPIYLERDEQRLASQSTGELPDDVRTIHSLDELLDLVLEKIVSPRSKQDTTVVTNTVPRVTSFVPVHELQITA